MVRRIKKENNKGEKLVKEPGFGYLSDGRLAREHILQKVIIRTAYVTDGQNRRHIYVNILDHKVVLLS